MADPSATMAVRVADLADAGDCAGIVTVLDTYASDPVGGGTPLSARTRERLLPLLRAQSNALVIIARRGERPVGIAICFFGLSTFAARPLLNIHDLAVVPDCRGQGIGRALLGMAEAVAAERGCCKLTLEVQEDNVPARTLYERFGFGDLVFGNSAPTRFLVKPID